MREIGIDVLASDTHDDLAVQLVAWLARVKPRRVLHIALAADGTELTYCIVIVYV